MKTPACISGTGASWIPSLGPDFADSPQQLGTTLQGYTINSSTGKRIKLLTPASLCIYLTIAFQSVRGARTFPSCARLAKGMELHCRRPRQPVFAGLCLIATYWQALSGTLISKVPSICVLSLTTGSNVLKSYLERNYWVRDQSPYSSCVDKALTFTIQRTKHRPAHHSALTKYYIAYAQVMITSLTTNFSSQEGGNCKTFSLRAMFMLQELHCPWPCSQGPPQVTCAEEETPTSQMRAAGAHVLWEQQPYAGWKNSVPCSNSAPSPSPHLQTLLRAVVKHHISALLPVLADVAEVQREDRENSLQVLQETENTLSRMREKLLQTTFACKRLNHSHTRT